MYVQVRYNKRRTSQFFFLPTDFTLFFFFPSFVREKAEKKNCAKKKSKEKKSVKKRKRKNKNKLFKERRVDEFRLQNKVKLELSWLSKRKNRGVG